MTMATPWRVDPCDRSGATLRLWDGSVWTDRTAPNPDGASPLPPWQRRPLQFLRHRWFHVLVLSCAVGGSAAILFGATRSPFWVALAAAVSAALASTAIAVFVDSRARFSRMVDARTLVAVCVAGGAVGLSIAQLERLLPKGPALLAAVGVIEEAAKIALPLALYFWGRRRFRDPRVGLAISLASAAGFAIGETATYAWHAADGSMTGNGVTTTVAVLATTIAKPLTDPFIHVCLTGIVAAVAWRQWHLAGRFRVDRRVVVALLMAMALHSVNDTAAAAVPLLAVGIVPIAVYLVFKHCARDLVPPDALAEVPPGWRPHRLPAVAESPNPSEWQRPAEIGAVPAAMPSPG